MVDMNQMAMANPSDWCTIGWAARKLGVSERSVRRYIDEGRLNAYEPRKLGGETPQRMLMVSQIEEHVAARRVLTKKESA